MVTHNNDIEALIAVFLSGEATPDQAMQVQDFIDESEENKSYFKELENTYSITHGISTFDTQNIRNVWKKISSENQKEKTKIIRFAPRKLVFAAASLLLFAMLTTMYFLMKSPTQPNGIAGNDRPKENPLKKQAFFAQNNEKSIILSDKSKVKLTKGSQLTLADDFNKKNRLLNLKGSATFEVIHDEKKPFIVSVEKLKIVDIGTVFRVESHSDTVKIVVDEGKVELRLNNSVLKMSAGDSAFYVIKTDFISRYETKKQRKNKIFEFDGTSLKEVSQVLSEFFEQEIVIKNKEIEDCPLTVRFKNEDLITILDLIKELMDIKVVKNNNVIELYGKGCN